MRRGRNKQGVDNMILGRDLRAAREAKGISLGRISQRIGRDKGHLSRVEREVGDREVTPALVRDYERALGSPVVPAIRMSPTTVR